MRKQTIDTPDHLYGSPRHSLEEENQYGKDGYCTIQFVEHSQNNGNIETEQMGDF